MILTNTDIFNGLKQFAAENEISLSALARKCGLHPTTFNPSKWTNRVGKRRGANISTLLRVFAAMGIGWTDFGKYLPNGGH